MRSTVVTCEVLRKLGACRDSVWWLEAQGGEVDVASLDIGTLPDREWYDWLLQSRYGAANFGELWSRNGWVVLVASEERTVCAGEKAVSFVGAPTVTVESGGVQVSCDQSAPTVTVESGGRQVSYAQSAPTVTVESCGVQRSYGQSPQPPLLLG